MGSGSSRSGRIPRRRRSPDRRQAGPGEATSEGGRVDQATTAATQEETGRDPLPATPPGGREETLRLLDQLLAESEAWGPQEPAPRGPARLPLAVSPEKMTKDNSKDSCASETSGSSHKRPEGQSPISYDYSEEELMASIEREYCR
ncbi:cystin-1 [Phodopus roborovskii]|uniref:Cys1 protein n=1 Tax=Phodopus roborovskii TaxID=109678 RepID=A0AAV0A971_PHORO|nr:cystin-1 [Phodopus roborovskii]CAH7301570.1 Cys1 [Phodopus roborovskii]